MTGHRTARSSVDNPISATGGSADADNRLVDNIRKLAGVTADAARQVFRFDHVTGLPTRAEFVADFPGNATAGYRSLILVTLADARHFNELLRALGHAYSEDFVRAGAERLIGVLGPKRRVYHVSVLSFAFLCEDEASASPPAILREIVGAFRPSLVCQDIPVDSRVGVGLVPLDPEVASSPSEILRAALAAAQDSRKGFDGWALYDRRTDEAHVRAFRILTDLPAAFERPGQLSLNFQPRVSLADDRCVGAEALIRWTHPVLGPVSPAEFVTLAETTALITPLTKWVIENALRAAARLDRAGRNVKLSINISPKNLEEPRFVELLLWEMNRFDIDPGMIELEFTEGALASNPQLMLQQLAILKRKGFDIAIDDFGSGYSNMSHLGKLPARVLKIDQSFIRPMETERKNQLLVRAIIDLAHALDYSVVAEGIETRALYGMLAGWDCDEGQGYFMSRPLTFDAFGEWMAAKGGTGGPAR